VYMFTYMHNEISGVRIYLHICTLRLIVCEYIYMYAH